MHSSLNKATGGSFRVAPLSLQGAKKSPGFTLIELLVVIAIIGILASLLMPTFHKSKQKAQGVLCLNNGRQIMTALMMYCGDNSDFFPPNPDDANTIPGHNWVSGDAGIERADEFNPDILRNEKLNLLARYLGGSIGAFHCPADKRFGLYTGADPALKGSTTPAARTFSMNQAFGTICPGFDEGGRKTDHRGTPTLSVNGPWLNNTRQHRRDSPWLTYGKLSSTQKPGPAMLWVLVDENADELNDAAFAFGMEHPVWYDVPGTYHDYGCGFAFADGHSETKAWLHKAAKYRGGAKGEADRKDWEWMRDRTSARAGD